MDFGSVIPGDLGDISAGLEGAARRLELCATQVGIATASSWQGEAAQLHRERVEEHARDLRQLVDELRAAADLVDALDTAATERLDLLSSVDRVSGGWRPRGWP